MSTTDILIVEPSKELTEVLARALAKNGMSCEVAHSARQGIKLADEQQPKLVILELVMPRHNGMEFIHEFRSYPDWLEVPLILYTNVSRDELQLSDSTLAEMGITGHFYKPTTSLARLVGAVESKLALNHI